MLVTWGGGGGIVPAPIRLGVSTSFDHCPAKFLFLSLPLKKMEKSANDWTPYSNFRRHFAVHIQ